MTNKKKILGAAGLVAVMVIGGTIAYFNQTMTVTNPFDTGKYNTVLREDFKPEEGKNWQPGAEVNKDIEVSNTGDYDVFVRVKFDEQWTRVNGETGKSDVIKKLDSVDETTYQENAKDGEIANDKSVVEKTLANSDKWVRGNDGYWYYKTNLAPKTSTGIFLDKVKLIEDADMGLYTVKNYYTEATNKPEDHNIGTDPKTQWVEYEKAMPKDATHTMAVTNLSPAAQGYAGAEYNLTITAQTIQATKAAMKDAFKLDAAPAGCSWTFKELPKNTK